MFWVFPIYRCRLRFFFRLAFYTSDKDKQNILFPRHLRCLIRNCYLVLVLFFLLTLYDLNRSYTSQSSIKTNPTSDDISSIPPPPKMKMQKAQIIKFRYCFTGGYQNLFKQFSELVHTHYPNMAVVGENYPPGPFKAAFAKALSIIKMGLLICLLFSQNPFSYLNIPTPRIYLWALQNKMYACLMIFFFSNLLESYLISTGAFEISVDNVPLWSKLETGRIPSANEFIQMLQPFGTNIDSNNNVRMNI